MKKELWETLASNLKSVRNEKGLTQAEVAKRTGLNTNYYAKVERGEARATLATLEKIIKALGTDSSKILPF